MFSEIVYDSISERLPMYVITFLEVNLMVLVQQKKSSLRSSSIPLFSVTFFSCLQCFSWKVMFILFLSKYGKSLMFVFSEI